MNKKIIGLLLSAVVFTGAGGFGTYAYFTSTYNLSEKVEIKMGSINVTGNWSKKNDGKVSKWEAENEKKKEVKLEENKENLAATNAKCGTTFSRKVTIKNEGTLYANVTVKTKNINNNLEVYFESNGKDDIKINNMKPEATKEITIKVKVNGKPGTKTENIFNGNIEDFIVIEAEQLN